MSEKEEKKYYELSESTLEVIENLIENMALPFPIKFKYLGTTKGKKVVQIAKVNDMYQFLTGYDIILVVNEDLSMRLDDVTLEILLYQELDRLNVNLEKGTVKISGYMLQTTPGVLNKYGIEAVSVANDLGEIAYEQSRDEDDDIEQADHNSKIRTNIVSSNVEFLND